MILPGIKRETAEMSSDTQSRTRARRAETGGVSRPRHAHHTLPSPPPAIPPPALPTSAWQPLPATPLPPDLSSSNTSSSAIQTAAADAPTPTPRKLLIKLIITERHNPITLAVRIPGLSHTAPRSYATPAQSPEKLTASPIKGKGREEANLEDTLLKEGTICISELLTVEDIRAMPSLEAPLTRKRRRASSAVETFVQLPDVKHRERRKKDGGALEEALTNGNGIGIASSSKIVAFKEERKGRFKGEKGKMVNGVNGSSHHNNMLTEIPNGVDKKKGHKTGEKLKEKGVEKAKEGKDGKKETEKERREKDLERNIDNVIFGDVTFKAWYPSWYPKEIIGEKALSCEGKGPGITVKELYVCRRCFGYSKALVDWVRHCRCCEREVPGSKVYTHGAEGEGGGWSVWEVDGSVETVSNSLSLPPSQILKCILMIGTNSSSVKTSPSLPSSSSTTNPSSSTSQASTTSCSCTPHLIPSKIKSSASSQKRKCRGITIISPVSSSFLHGNERVSVRYLWALVTPLRREKESWEVPKNRSRI
jgi:hypothetical protein